MGDVGQSCPVCDQFVENEIDYVNGSYPFLEGESNIFRQLKINVCSACGFSFSFPFLSSEDLGCFYGNVYRKDPRSPHHMRQKSKASFLSLAPMREFAQIMLGSVFKNISNVNSFLDIGSSFGASFWAMRKISDRCKCYAVEQDPVALKDLRSQNVNVVEQVSGLIKFPKEYFGKFDFVLLSHVLEHFNGHQVVEILGNIREVIAKDGVIVCEVPYDDFRAPASQRNNDAPHLSFFSIQSLKMAFEKAGYRILFAGAVGDSRHVAPAILVSDKMGTKRFVVNAIKRIPIISRFLNVANGYRKRDTLNVLASDFARYDDSGSCIRLCAGNF